jgi:hypothetical protein
VPLGNPVTVAAIGRANRPSPAKKAFDQSCGERKRQEPGVTRLNEGVGEHVRIKISPRQKKRGRNCEPNCGSAPSEENLFLLPDRLGRHACHPKFDPAV